MQLTTIASTRLSSQHIASPHSDNPSNIVSYMGAMQAQDYNGSLWSIGLRSETLTRHNIEQAIEARQILRTWPMRGTIHFLAADDARWITRLSADRMISSAAGRSRELEINDESLTICRRIVEKALCDGPLPRQEIMDLFEADRQSTKGQRGYHILWRLALDGVICFGPHQGKQPTFALLDQWIPKSRFISGDEALYELAVRYFTSHGPATIKDFAGWASITMSDAKRGLATASEQLQSTVVEQTEFWHTPNPTTLDEPSAFLLPGFDEFMLGYKDRSAALVAEHANKIVPGNNGMFKPTIVFDGQIIGTWKKVERKDQSLIALEAFESIDDSHHKRLDQAIKKYSHYLEQPVHIAS